MIILPPLMLEGVDTTRFYGHISPQGGFVWWTTSSEGRFQGCNLEYAIDVTSNEPLAGTLAYREWREKVEQLMDAAAADYKKDNA